MGHFDWLMKWTKNTRCGLTVSIHVLEQCLDRFLVFHGWFDVKSKALLENSPLFVNVDIYARQEMQSVVEH